MSREKGKRGEREVVTRLRELWGGRPRRTAQVDGKLSADVIGALVDPVELTDWHVEVKRVARLPVAFKKWMAQAKEDANAGRDVEAEGERGDYVVVFREDNGEWFIVMPLAVTPQFAYDLHEQLEEETL